MSRYTLTPLHHRHDGSHRLDHPLANFLQVCDVDDTNDFMTVWQGADGHAIAAGLRQSAYGVHRRRAQSLILYLFERASSSGASERNLPALEVQWRIVLSEVLNRRRTLARLRWRLTSAYGKTHGILTAYRDGDGVVGDDPQGSGWRSEPSNLTSSCVGVRSSRSHANLPKMSFDFPAGR
jgi:hypothetical protein